MKPLTHSCLLRARNDLCQKWRAYMLDNGAIEVSTPALDTFPDIAPVRQFTTLHPTVGTTSYLRIAPTEHLKRFIASGEECVFEFSKNFRDDVADATHLPEFTSLEFMARGKTCADMELVAVDLCGLAVEVVKGTRPDAEPPTWVQHWDHQQVTRLELAVELQDRFGLEPAWICEPVKIARTLDTLGEAVKPHTKLPILLDQLITAIARREKGVVLMSGFPELLGGPAEPHELHAGFKQRCELFIDGLEVANMSSNLTDGQALRKWHETGVQAKKVLGIGSNFLNEELLNALDGRLPCSAVIGIGVERILQAAFDLSDIRILQ